MINLSKLFLIHLLVLECMLTSHFVHYQEKSTDFPVNCRTIFLKKLVSHVPRVDVDHLTRWNAVS